MLARPFASVVTGFGVPSIAPAADMLLGAANVTVPPEIGLPPISTSLATNGLANALLIVVVCGLPELTSKAAGAPTRLVRPKLVLIAPLAPDAVAVTLNVPTVAFALGIVLIVAGIWFLSR